MLDELSRAAEIYAVFVASQEMQENDKLQSLLAELNIQWWEQNWNPKLFNLKTTPLSITII